MMREPPSLFWRLMAAISVVLLAGAGVIAYAAYSYALAAADQAYDRFLLSAASQIGETIRVADGAVTTDIPVSAFETLSPARRERVFYRVSGPGGAFVTGYDDLAIPSDLQQPGPEPRIWNAVYKGFPVRAAATSHYVSDPALSGWSTVVVAQTRLGRDSLARDLTLRAMLLVGIMSFIALAGTAVAVRYALSPLHRIEHALGARDPNDLTPLAVTAPAEIEELVQSINRFMRRLSDRLDSLQRSIADAAHQIRTPVTALSAQVDLLSRETDSKRRKHQVQRISARTSQIGRLVSQLLSHAMVSHRAQSITAQQVDLRELLNLAISDAVPLAMTRDLEVEVDSGKAPAHIEGDPVSLREAIRNVIENAVHHGAHERILASVSQDAVATIVEVADDGPGIPAGLWPHVQERFFRGTQDGPGSGLGLAIVADVMRAHRGHLAFRQDPGGLFRVQMIFPGRGAAA
jgi:two-component system sensor histidine kinase TctE